MVNVGTKIEETHHLKVYSAVRKVPNGECWWPKLKKHLCLCRQGEKPWVKFVDSREKNPNSDIQYS